MQFLTRKIFLALGAIIFLLSFGCKSGKDAGDRYFPHRDAPGPPHLSDDEALAFIEDDFLVKPGFSSHLPLLVFDASGLTVFDRGAGNNKFTDPPVFHSPIRIRTGGDQPDKGKEGLFAFGTDNGMPITGMGSGSDWALSASIWDKSLIRNYLAYCLASELMPETPGVVFCEVFLREEEGLKYQGVYLLVEDAGLAGNTVSALDGKLRRVIYSDDPKTFNKYPEVIDVESFADFFIVNEFLQNDNAVFFSAYVHFGDKVRLGPVRDNDRILGNNFPEPYDPEIITMQKIPFFERLTRDVAFLDRLESRYSKLRRNILHDDSVIRLVDDTAGFLGPAQLRDWKRWSSEYTRPLPQEKNDPANLSTSDQPMTFEQELIKIKYLIIRHGRVMGNSIHQLTWQDNLFDSSYNTRKSTILIVVFCFLFVSAVRIGRRR